MEKRYLRKLVFVLILVLFNADGITVQQGVLVENNDHSAIVIQGNHTAGVAVSVDDTDCIADSTTDNVAPCSDSMEAITKEMPKICMK